MCLDVGGDRARDGGAAGAPYLPTRMLASRR